MRTAPAIALVLFASALAGCAGNNATGTGVAGPLQAAAVAPPPGGIGAGLVGSEVGTALDSVDRNRALKAEYDALQSTITGAPVMWQSTSRSAYGEVVAGPLQNIGQYECRYYTHTIYVDGVRDAAAGTSCRLSGGPWQLAL